MFTRGSGSRKVVYEMMFQKWNFGLVMLEKTDGSWEAQLYEKEL